jgi:hypothetical protein
VRVTSALENCGTRIIADAAVDFINVRAFIKIGHAASEVIGCFGLSKWRPRKRSDQAEHKHHQTPHSNTSRRYIAWLTFLQSRPINLEANLNVKS